MGCAHACQACSSQIASCGSRSRKTLKSLVLTPIKFCAAAAMTSEILRLRNLTLGENTAAQNILHGGWRAMCRIEGLALAILNESSRPKESGNARRFHIVSYGNRARRLSKVKSGRFLLNAFRSLCASAEAGSSQIQKDLPSNRELTGLMSMMGHRRLVAIRKSDPHSTKAALNGRAFISAALNLLAMGSGFCLFAPQKSRLPHPGRGTIHFVAAA